MSPLIYIVKDSVAFIELDSKLVGVDKPFNCFLPSLTASVVHFIIFSRASVGITP